MKLVSFDRNYLHRLAGGDPEVERHFTVYFQEIILVKLISRRFPTAHLKDIVQETLLRVVHAVRHDRIESPEKFGSFVNSVCDRVISEFHRSHARYQPLPEGLENVRDPASDLLAPLVNEERKAFIRDVLDDLNASDREILRLLFFEELPRREICRRLNVSEDYLRVLFYRAKSRFRQSYKKVILKNSEKNSHDV